jgi:flavin reductase (DIM6/NTAB) family NADH-FMN oxidoreductase RutF
VQRRRAHYGDHYHAVVSALTSRGLLLGSYDASERPNLMTIGWGALGSVWGEPTWVVLVRPSRYTYRCLEHSGCFSVNAPTPEMANACALCGSASGREVDKFARCRLTAQRASTVQAPVVAECPVVYECRVVHRNDVVPAALDDQIARSAYAGGDFHRVYFGRIMATFAVPEAAALLSTTRA